MFTFSISFDTLEAMQKFLVDLSEKDLRQGKLDLGPPINANEVNELAKEQAAAKAVETPDFPTDPVEALKKVNAAKGLSVCMAILARFGAKRVGEISKEDQASFIAACVAELGA